jgi:hypothetical protein
MKYSRIVLVGLAVSLAVGGILSLFASPDPDGLERAAAEAGFEHAAREKPLLASPFADYLLPGIGDRRLAAGLAGALGTLTLFAVGTAIGAAVGAAKKAGTWRRDGTRVSR